MKIEKRKFAILLAARSGSKRLPNKHFLRLKKNLNIIEFCILRLKKSKWIDQIFLCTTKNKNDDKFKKISNKHKIKLFRGSTENVAKRFIDCSKKYKIETIVRITADCPLIDPVLVDNIIELHVKKKNDYTSNVLHLSFPDGLDVEVFNLKALIKSQKLLKTKKNKEHVTLCLRKSKEFKKSNYLNKINYSNRRWTLDYLEDYIFLKKVFDFFYPNIFFSWKDLIYAEKKNNLLKNIFKR